MRRKHARASVLALVIASAFSAPHANAYIINFTAEGITGPGLDASNLTSGPLDVSTPIGTVVFSGGAVATDLSGAPADEDGDAVGHPRDARVRETAHCLLSR
jgi:hypothetical protein